jgi:hypothetical protein
VEKLSFALWMTVEKAAEIVNGSLKAAAHAQQN